MAIFANQGNGGFFYPKLLYCKWNSLSQKNKKIMLGIMVVFSIISAVYFFVLYEFGTNIPVEDEFYGALYYQHLLNKAGLAEKFRLLFFHHNQHTALMNRIFYYVEIFVLGRFDFFYETLVGNSQLLLMPFFVWKMVGRVKNNRTYLFVFPLIFFLNVSLWYQNFWGGISIASNFALVCAIIICILVENQSLISFFVGIILLFIISFSYANGILMAVISSIQILFCNRSHREKIIWLTMSTCIIALYLFLFDYSAYQGGGFVVGQHLDGKLLTISKTIYLAPMAFFMLIGSAPFPTTAPVWPGVVTGGGIAFMVYKMLFFYWKNDKPSFYPLAASLLYCALTFGLISVVRVPWSGIHVAYASHFKIYSLYIFSLVTVFYGKKIKSKYIASIFLFIMAAIPIQSSIYNFKIMSENQKDKREQITNWALEGTRDSLGNNGRWFPLSEQILFSVAEEGIYSPFDTKRGSLDQVESIQEIGICPDIDRTTLLDSQIFYKTGAMAASISLENKFFDEILLCSDLKNYKLIPFDGATRRVVFEKKYISKGVYGIYFKRGGEIIGKSKEVITMMGEKRNLSCEGVWAPTYKIYEKIKNDICKKVYK